MEKPYYSLDKYFKGIYGEKCYKIAIDAGLSCPNRDGTIGYGGCTFCSAGGSGDFAVSRAVGSIQDQIDAGLALFGDKKTGNRFVAYYQAYTNTYGKPSLLEQIYREGLSHPQIMGISIATRPDCLSFEILDLLDRLRREYAPKFIWIELGLQTCHERTARLINRGYPLSVFEQAMRALREQSIPTIVHVILGLPGETPEDMYATVSYLNAFQPFGIKLQLLHILKGTGLALDYEQHSPDLHIMELQEYIHVLIHCLELLDPGIIIHRLTGDGPKDLLLAPLWSLNKRKVLNTLHQTLKDQKTYQGRCYHYAGSIDSL
ncbi:MAG: TIGR01212 family radical SAM protein [Lachnospiraceae bacterium]|nr:TIGR01212 family radical SAM protein [Lachnospiraceae bacterium]